MTGPAQLGPALQLLRLTTGSLRDHGPRDDAGCRRLAALAVPVPASRLAGVGRAQAAFAIPHSALKLANVGWAKAALAIPNPTFLSALGAGLGRRDAASILVALVARFAHALTLRIAQLVRPARFGRGRRRDATSILVALVARFAHALALRVTLFVRPRLAQWRRFRAAPALGHRLAVGTQRRFNDTDALALLVADIAGLADAGPALAAEFVGLRLALRPVGLDATLRRDLGPGGSGVVAGNLVPTRGGFRPRQDRCVPELALLAFGYGGRHAELDALSHLEIDIVERQMIVRAAA